MSSELNWHPLRDENGDLQWLLVTSEEQSLYYAATINDCNHAETEYRDRTIQGGGMQRNRQCLCCGRVVGNSIKREPHVTVPEWDAGLTDRKKAEFADERFEIYEIALERTANLEIDGYVDYEEYLVSETWSKKRRAVLKRDNLICQACLSREATEVHHLTYERIFEEPMFDLVSICRPCHEKLHRKKIAAAAAAKAKSGDIPDMPT